nr:immunoglobulin light chain junction region [Macaca mulatta]
CQHHHSYPPTF